MSSSVAKRTPAEALRPFITEYVFRTVKVPVVKAMPLRYLSSIDFFLGADFETTDHRTGELLPFSRCSIRGPRTFRKSAIRIEKDFVSFVIRFKPTGLYGLLGISAHLFRDEAIDGALVLPALFPEITERLMACKDIDSCIAVVEPYLLVLAKKASYTSVGVDQMVKLVMASSAKTSINALQQKVCLSQRQLERNFVKEIGTTPKLYSRMVRFSNMLQHKMHHTDTKWSGLAYEFDYADQMHLIKDFQHFLGVSPGDFVAEDFAF
ncbi:helix-turn-helix domain-containing protein [Chitinophaga sp. SYP-B3965]|uniref:helix-turn-helix domain-containing protein n=1 Tax=Chitinophaga sp. SYP-B3965 TaxID=2663120 RepID=UPI0012998420|nr:AraC family transcriptional regulator [Chitinophaga sp. SYP-B3965]MRG45798.1 helix-turn-helix domain-containing protein [Chitinophaga sp. SYP-B3965]